VVGDAALSRYNELAGVDTVLSPRQLLGRSLANEVPTAVTTTLEDSVGADGFEPMELTVTADSDIRDEPFGQTRLEERFGVHVVGGWFDGEFATPLDPSARLEAGTRLLVAGKPDQLSAIRDAIDVTITEFTPQEILLVGYGDTGKAVADELATTSSTLTTLDVKDKDDVDVVGDARDPETLRAAGIESASVLILAVEDDTTAIFATLIARDLNPDLRIVVRSNEEEDVQKLSRAGADFVQSLATVSGRMLASTVFQDEDRLTDDKQVNIVRLPAPRLAGQTIVDAEVLARTGCTTVAIVREGVTITDFDPTSFELEAGDEVVIAGTDDAITRFRRRFSSPGDLRMGKELRIE
ncbi:MAG: NAD-binding protein, partial [Halapricum sp.]